MVKVLIIPKSFAKNMAIAYMNRYSTPCIKGCCTRCPVAVCHCVHRLPFWGSCGTFMFAMVWRCCHILAGFPTTGSLSENPAPSRNEPVTLNGRLCVHTLRYKKKPRRMQRKRLTMLGECKKSLNLHYSYCTSSLDIIHGIEDGHEDN